MLGRFRLTRSVANVPSSDDLEPQEASFRVSSPLLDDSEPVFQYGDFKSDSQNACPEYSAKREGMEGDKSRDDAS